MLAGKNVSIAPYIGALSEGFSGACSPKDFETMLQLLYLYFEQPRFDADAHKAIIDRNRAAIVNMANNPQKEMQDSLKRIFSNYNPRVRLFNSEYLDDVDLTKMEEVYRDRISDASDFTFVLVGDLSIEKVKPLVEKYIGSLTDIDRKENWKDRSIKRAKGKTVKKLKFPMATPKGTVILKYSKDAKYNSHNRICQSIIASILDLRYTENIREKEGGTYGVSVSPGVSRIPNERLSMSISFNCSPDKADYLKDLVYKEIETFIKHGPTQEELDKVLTSIKKNSEQSKNHNSYWLGALVSLYNNGDNVLSPDYFDNVINNLSVKDIRKAAKRFFKKADVIDVTVLPE
jgi:zinc protease